MRVLRSALALAVLGVLAPSASAVAAVDGRDDVTVVAVLDDGLNPYHWDFHASRMPQHLDADPSNDLPVDAAPHTWIPGFPDPATFGDYRALNITIPGYGDVIAGVRASDDAEWKSTSPSSASTANYYWVPGTKVVGAMNFGGGDIAGSTASHGAGTTSVSVGNIYGSCPECVLVFIQYADAASGERAIEWALSQPWIDAISNSYGFSRVNRDRLYAGSDTAAQRAAIERGQTVFFSAGNGQENSFVIPNTTYYSSQEGPDWIVTVGAVTPGGAPYSGSGKAADIASVGASYPASIGVSQPAGWGGSFGGTSNATPVVTGTYARALHVARAALDGPSKTQSGGVIATGAPVACGVARADCELGDGVLTAPELRRLLSLGAAPVTAGLAPGGVVAAPRVGEEGFLATGYGAYYAKIRSHAEWVTEFDAALREPMLGLRALRARPAGEAEWMVVDSFCRQHLWGSWGLGAYRAGSTPLPGTDGTYPLRSSLEAACPSLPAPF